VLLPLLNAQKRDNRPEAIGCIFSVDREQTGNPVSKRKLAMALPFTRGWRIKRLLLQLIEADNNTSVLMSIRGRLCALGAGATDDDMVGDYIGALPGLRCEALAEAVDALGKYGRPQAISPLLALLGDERVRVSVHDGCNFTPLDFKVAIALAALGNATGVGLLVRRWLGVYGYTVHRYLVRINIGATFQQFGLDKEEVRAAYASYADDVRRTHFNYMSVLSEIAAILRQLGLREEVVEELVRLPPKREELEATEGAPSEGYDGGSHEPFDDGRWAWYGSGNDAPPPSDPDPYWRSRY